MWVMIDHLDLDKLIFFQRDFEVKKKSILFTRNFEVLLEVYFERMKLIHYLLRGHMYFDLNSSSH